MSVEIAVGLVLVFGCGIVIGLFVNGWRVQEAKEIITDLDRIAASHAAANAHLIVERQHLRAQVQACRDGECWKVREEA